MNVTEEVAKIKATWRKINQTVRGLEIQKDRLARKEELLRKQRLALDDREQDIRDRELENEAWETRLYKLERRLDNRDVVNGKID